MALTKEEGYLVEGVVLAEFTTIEDVPRTFYTDCATEISGEQVWYEGAELSWPCRNGIRAQKKRNDILLGHDGAITDVFFAPKLFGALLNAEWDELNKTFISTAIGEQSTQLACNITFYSEADNTDTGTQGWVSTTLPRCTCEVTNLISGTNDAEYTKYEVTFKSRPNRGEHPYSIAFVDALPEDEVVS